MREGLLNDIRAEYEVLRANNQAEELRRREHAALVDPQIAELFEKRQRRFQDAFQSALKGSVPDSLATDIETMNRSLRERLIRNGLPEDYLQPLYACDKCGDTGYVGDTLLDRCECFARRIRDRLLSEPNHGLNSTETFSSFDPGVYPDSSISDSRPDSQRAFMVRMRDRCLEYAETYPENSQRNLLLLGMSGLGKTYLMNCVGNHLLSKGHEVRKITAYQLSEHMRASIFDRDANAFEPLLAVPMLMLDDLGVEPLMSNITIECLFTLLNERDLNGLHTVISSNLTTVELTQRYTERVCSRLFSRKNTSMLHFVGKDVRLR
ncbi:MAG: ATP-binding protein [Clostridia bacterium]|nr:ATP-binding protein [Clostridia bacterium]